MTLESFVLRIIVALLVAVAIGVERQVTGHNVGVKTTILITIGTFAFTVAGVFGGDDSMRMAANVITGTGFLCGSVIFKNGLTVSGLNTSATLWGTAGISVLIGIGFVWQGAIVAAFMVALNLLMTKISVLVKPVPTFCETTESTFTINVVCLSSAVPTIEQIILNNLVPEIDFVEFQTNTITNDKVRMKAKLDATKKQLEDVNNITNKILESNDVMSAGWEKSSG